jgi:hypothetical protein
LVRYFQMFLEQEFSIVVEKESQKLEMVFLDVKNWRLKPELQKNNCCWQFTSMREYTIRL